MYRSANTPGLVLCLAADAGHSDVVCAGSSCLGLLPDYFTLVAELLVYEQRDVLSLGESRSIQPHERIEHDKACIFHAGCETVPSSRDVEHEHDCAGVQMR